MKIFTILLLAALVGTGCAPTHVSRAKQQQVALVTQTGQYAYLRAGSPAGGPR